MGATASRVRAPQPTTASDARRPRTSVVLVGDSMVREARFVLANRAPGTGLDLQVIDRGQGAPCNQLDQIRTELAKAPAVLVIEWVGNARFTVPCTKTFTSDEVVAEYRAALAKVIAVRPASTTIALVGAPPIELAPWSTTWAPLDALYRELAQTNAGVDYIDTTSTLAPGGTFTRTLPCAAAGASTGSCGTFGAPLGQAVIRDPLGFHFCPVKYDFGATDCPVPSPGAALYATAILTGIDQLLAAR